MKLNQLNTVEDVEESLKMADAILHNCWCDFIEQEIKGMSEAKEIEICKYVMAYRELVSKEYKRLSEKVKEQISQV